MFDDFSRQRFATSPRWAISASTWGRSRWLRVIGVRCERVGQGGINSGRKVSTCSIGTVGVRLDDQLQQFHGRRISPVQVLPHRQHRLSPGLFKEPCHQRIKRLPLLLLGRQAQRRIAAIQGSIE